MFSTNPQAIVWTQAEPTYQQVDFRDYISADIQSIQTWIAKETELSSFRNFHDNWDGLDAAAPDSTLVGKGLFLLRLLKERDPSNPPKRVVLSTDGFIALEWVDGNRLIQAEVGDSDEIEWMIAMPGQPTNFSVEPLVLDSGFGRMEGRPWQPPATVAADEPAYASAL
jgi:hypothetical protein